MKNHFIFFFTFLVMEVTQSMIKSMNLVVLWGQIGRGKDMS